jgi:hypothetical protein
MRIGRFGCWFKGALVLACLLLITQTPFIYRRYQLGRLAATIQQLNAQRKPATDDLYADYRGAIHVHSSLGGHSTGTLTEIIQAARANSLAFVVMTEHPAADMDTAAQTLNGLHGGVLFIAGNETSESEQDHLLTFGGKMSEATNTPAVAEQNTSAPAGGNNLTTQQLIDRAKRAGQLVFIAHPETFSSWQTAHGFDGMEIYNLHANAKQINRLSLFFDGLWSYRSYPQLLWTRFYETPTENLKRWDELNAATRGGGQRVVAIAANDAHANVGLSLQELTGQPILQIKFDPYERSFQVVRTHVLIDKQQPLTTDTLLAALAAGHAYVSFDLLCDASGFRLTADNGQERKLLGDEIFLHDGVRLRVATPVDCRMVLIRDGQKFDEARGTEHEWTVREPGVYRIECYLPQLPAALSEKPWIISNPVFVK